MLLKVNGELLQLSVLFVTQQMDGLKHKNADQVVFVEEMYTPDPIKPLFSEGISKHIKNTEFQTVKDKWMDTNN